MLNYTTLIFLSILSFAVLVRIAMGISFRRSEERKSPIEKKHIEMFNHLLKKKP